MKVTDTSGAGVSGLGRAQELTTTGTSAHSRGQRAASSDQVSLSNLSSAISAQQTNSPERGEKVSSLAEAVGAGSYMPDPQELSGSIIQAHMQA